LTPALALSDATLPRLGPRVAVPAYDRHALVPSVVHISVGSFHRSHQAVYFDDLAQQGISTAWGLTGIGLRRPEMRQVLDAQDGLYTVVSRDAERDRARVVGSIRGYLFAPEDGEAVLRLLADPRTRIVTLTITGSGYKVDPATGTFAAGDPEIVADLRAPRRPGTAVGHLVEALDRRRRAGLPPFTVLSCDNVAGNGPLARTALVEFARLRDPALARWIDEHGAFPSSMVDRITPKTTLATRAWVEREFGVADRWPVITEPFRQWVIEDEFCDGRPPLDRVGARFVDDVRPYSLTKTRLLNAGHCALGHLGVLAGLTRTDEAMADPVFAAAIRRMMDREVTPLLPEVRGFDLERYKGTLMERFANPKLGDDLSRLCRSGSSKVPTHVVSSIVEARALGVAHPLLTTVVAGWLRYLRGVDEQGCVVEIDDPLAGRLRPLATEAGCDPRPLLAERALFGALGEDADFVAELEAATVALEERGARPTLQALLVRGDGVAA
jgi:mannitol-1-phosphate/altronate dehydrogenase